MLSFQPYENYVSLSVCWNAELVPGGHNSHTVSLVCGHVCMLGGALEPCEIAMLVFCAPALNLFGLCISPWQQAALVVREITPQLEGLGSSPHVASTNRAGVCESRTAPGLLLTVHSE